LFVFVCRRAHVLFTLFVFVCRRAHVLFTLFVFVCRRAHVLFTCLCLFPYSGVQHILCCVVRPLAYPLFPVSLNCPF
jgi:hypothetical protein